MEKVILIILLALNVGISVGQSTDELNKKSKELLDKQDFKTALPLIKQAAEKGHPEAQYNYGVCYQQAIEVPQDDSIANIWFIKSAKQGWKDAQFKIAYSYATARGT